MNFKLPSVILVLALMSFVGCGQTTVSDTDVTKPDDEHIHMHEHGDELTWVATKNVESKSWEIQLGHHGAHFHPGDTIEPAMTVSKYGKPVAGLTALVSLNSQGLEMVFEPETPDERAHYAQAELSIPKDAKQVMIKFTIVLPESPEPIFSDEIKLDLQ